VLMAKVMMKCNRSIRNLNSPGFPRLMKVWSNGWDQGFATSRELRRSLRFPADLRLNRYKPAAHRS
jgi:hypothetical protein